MTDLVEKLLKAFYELWHDSKWPRVKTAGVPGIYLAVKAGITSQEELQQVKKIRYYPSSAVHQKIAPVLLEMIEKGWIKPIEGKYANYNEYEYSPWGKTILNLCGHWGYLDEIEEFKKMERQTGVATWGLPMETLVTIRRPSSILNKP